MAFLFPFSSLWVQFHINFRPSATHLVCILHPFGVPTYFPNGLHLAHFGFHFTSIFDHPRPIWSAFCILRISDHPGSNRSAFCILLVCRSEIDSYKLFERIGQPFSWAKHFGFYFRQFTLCSGSTTSQNDQYNLLLGHTSESQTSPYFNWKSKSWTAKRPCGDHAATRQRPYGDRPMLALFWINNQPKL